jgi:hypothetical protein
MATTKKVLTAELFIDVRHSSERKYVIVLPIIQFDGVTSILLIWIIAVVCVRYVRQSVSKRWGGDWGFVHQSLKHVT